MGSTSRVTTVQVAVKSFRFPFTIGETKNEEYEGRSAAVRKVLTPSIDHWTGLDLSR
jgi:hypothetical protein